MFTQERYDELIRQMKGVLNKCVNRYECLDADEEKAFEDTISVLKRAKKSDAYQQRVMNLLAEAGVITVTDEEGE